MTTPIEAIAGLVIGTVESVSPDEIRILLELDAPQATALNTGTPAAFPRLNGYVLIPNEAGATVAYISWIGIERSPYPKRAGLKDFGLIDLPFPLRKMCVSPVGTLTSRRDRVSKQTIFELSRGVVAFPSVGDQVLMPTPEQVGAIVGAKETDRRVRIGTSALAASAEIKVDPDKLFGRHLAVLGNTGSGKSCTVAGLIRWSLDASEKAMTDAGCEGQPNARFIVLDPNGEYAKAFVDRGDQLRLFRVPPVQGTEKELDVPAWLWSGHEWTAVAHAQPGAQRPLLLRGLRELKSGHHEDVPREAVIKRHLLVSSGRIAAMLNIGSTAFAGAVGARFDCARLLLSVQEDATRFAASVDLPSSTLLQTLSTEVAAVVDPRRSGQYFNDFLVSDLETVRASITKVTDAFPDVSGVAAGISEDAPVPFDVTLLAEHLDHLAAEQGGNFAAFISTLGLRIRSMLADHRLGGVIAREPPTSFEEWLKSYVGDDGARNGPLAVIDLSLVPSEVVHVVVAVLARVIFESLQRYRRLHPDGLSLPTVLVLEEAHTFIRRGKEDEGPASSPSQLCREIFERIAREGRKFGLGLVLSSQRPSELSATVLAQCNTFILHRIVNDSDQNLVARLVPDNVGGLLRDLPSLPSKQAILLGWATPIPVLVEIDELAKEHQPQSSDPDFWNVWTGKSARHVDWGQVSRQWSASTAPIETAEGRNADVAMDTPTDESSFDLDDDISF
ncbi:ATP-binding protein [Gluconacetobacter tumulicola]|uniref:ATP-binding protein n=1 Tax=Gluconacetobacter tumulicola TaxID=1017177 RepID=A0A7W4JG36_9PROT|nr:ATP-binding protein [Gluconacetobacter tumulicola]MBB2180407.1 ATP-binding protein [Gluconacetobacter tumulicola]